MDTCTVSIWMGRPEMKTDAVSRAVLLEQPCSGPCTPVQCRMISVVNFFLFLRLNFLLLLLLYVT